MIAVTGTIDSIEAVHDAVRRMEETAAIRYDQLAGAAQLMQDKDAAATLHSLAAAARRRARTYSGSASKPDHHLPPMPPLSPDGLEIGAWQVMEMALDTEYAMLTMIEVILAMAETDESRAEAQKLAERKRLHLIELESRQGRLDTPVSA
ncbi:hypothetical protein [Magnetospirillum sp. 64-120]|uniref:hypothetical protein n=1 Tax=Magnetospirillum sp. 64-120 TaxID=1895778 RepID=UPI0009266DC1|nr:hypothetical protein [Magnetospirillum sp. 64-120]OJX72182.1 MAG: hypothetical protein BGO92_16815 [Magnetospirillum sp. 64-120]